MNKNRPPRVEVKGGMHKEGDTNNGLNLKNDPETHERRLDKEEEACSSGSSKWSLSEIKVLLEARKKEHEMFSDSRRSMLMDYDKWKFVSDYCFTRGVPRMKHECQSEWEDSLIPEYRKIKADEERRISSDRGAAYFASLHSERRSQLHAANMNLEVYQQMDAIICSKPGPKGNLSSLKRQARMALPTSPALTATEDTRLHTRVCSDEVGGAVNNVADPSMKRMAALPKRRKRGRQTEKVTAEYRIGPPQRESSSTEEDESIAIAMGRSPAVVDPCMFYEEEKMKKRRENNNNTGWGLKLDQSGNTGAPSELRETERRDETVAYIQRRKDARHSELLALEREKLATFKEASSAMVSALNNAVSVFTKLADELLKHPRR